MYFPAGSRCTWKGDWNTIGFFNSPVTQVSEVTSGLESNANMVVESSSVTEPDVFSTSSTRTVTLKIRTLIDRNDINDIDADIRHAFYVAMNQEPDASSVQSYTIAGKTGSTGAPNPTADNNPDNSNNPDEQSAWDKIKEALGLDKIGAGLMGVGIGAVLVVGLIVVVAVKQEAT